MKFPKITEAPICNHSPYLLFFFFFGRGREGYKYGGRKATIHFFG